MSYPVCDLHCDTLLRLRDARRDGEPRLLKKNDFAIDLEKMEQGGMAIQTFALFTDRKNKAGYSPEHEALSLLNEYQKQIAANPDTIIPIQTLADLDGVLEKGCLGALLSLEEGDVMFQDLDLLEFWYNAGVRLIALTWNYPNAIAFPNVSFDDLEEVDYRIPSPLFRIETEKGLTDYGRAFVQKCEELGILIDVSHLGDKAFWDLMDIATKPVIASHSNCRALCPVSRNLDDDQIRAIAQTGGVIGLNFCADFLKENSDNKSQISDMVAHLRHLKEIGGIDVCAIGTDFDGIGSEVEIQDASQHQKLAQALLEDGFTDQEVAQILGGNVIDLLRKTLH